MDGEQPNSPNQVSGNKNHKKNLVRTWVAVGVIVLIFIIAAASSKNKNTPTAPVEKDTSTNSQSSTSGSLTLSGSSTTAGSASATTAPAPAATAPTCSPVSEAASLEGTNGCIEFTGYAYTATSSGQMYLDQYASAPYGFSAWIPAGYSFGPGALSEYSGQEIDVTGSIVSYRGEPEIEVTNASQIELAQ